MPSLDEATSYEIPDVTYRSPSEFPPPTDTICCRWLTMTGPLGMTVGMYAWVLTFFPPDNRRVRVIAIGAGVSGIQTAYQVQKDCEK